MYRCSLHKGEVMTGWRWTKDGCSDAGKPEFEHGSIQAEATCCAFTEDLKKEREEDAKSLVAGGASSERRDGELLLVRRCRLLTSARPRVL